MVFVVVNILENEDESCYNSLEELFEDNFEKDYKKDYLIEQRSERFGVIETSMGMFHFFSKYEEFNLPDRLPQE